ncbi:MAG: hypothetical protein ACW981_21430 [Candidatus Hodarchaeales archaeon]
MRIVLLNRKRVGLQSLLDSPTLPDKRESINRVVDEKIFDKNLTSVYDDAL